MESIFMIYNLISIIYISLVFVIQNIVNNNIFKELDKLQIDNKILLNELTVLKIHKSNMNDTIINIVKTIPFRGEEWIHNILTEELEKNMKRWEETTSKEKKNNDVEFDSYIRRWADGLGPNNDEDINVVEYNNESESE
jgi:hypothetical protein